MAATDITSILKSSKNTITEPGSQVFATKYLIDVTNPALVGIETVATHNLVSLPVDDVIVGGGFLVKTDFAGASATLTFQIGNQALSGVILVASLLKGTFFPFYFTPQVNSSAVVNAALGNTLAWAHTSADTIDWAIATTAFTAGAGWLILFTIQDISGQ